jgi:hypothetical protein
VKLIVSSFLQVVSDAMLAELKQCFLEAYDDNQDGKIEIREVSSFFGKSTNFSGPKMFWFLLK